MIELLNALYLPVGIPLGMAGFVVATRLMWNEFDPDNVFGYVMVGSLATLWGAAATFIWPLLVPIAFALALCGGAAWLVRPRQKPNLHSSSAFYRNAYQRAQQAPPHIHRINRDGTNSTAGCPRCKGAPPSMPTSPSKPPILAVPMSLRADATPLGEQAYPPGECAHKNTTDVENLHFGIMARLCLDCGEKLPT